MKKVCPKHRADPAIIYNPCVGCELERLREEREEVIELLKTAMTGLEWFLESYPNAHSEADDEFFHEVKKVIGDW